MNAKIQLGFLGLGQMGGPMAERLIAPGITLHVYDPSPDAIGRLVAAGAVAHTSPHSVADAASIVMACLPNGEVSKQTAYGPHGVAQGKAIRVYVEMSTIGRTTIVDISDKLEMHGIRTVDAPISGGPPGARNGTLAVMISGVDPAVLQAEPWLKRISQKLYILGEQPGQAQVMKLVNNLLMATNFVVAAEGLIMGAKAGLNPDMMMEVVKAGTGRSAAASEILAHSVLTGAFNFGASLSIVAKDVDLGIAEAHHLGVSLAVIEQARLLWKDAISEGLEKEDFTAIVKMLEQRGGAAVRSKSDKINHLWN